MTLFGYRVPMMASLLVWCVVWEIVGRLDLMVMLPPFSEVLAAAVDLVQTPSWQSATVTTLRAFVIGMALSIADRHTARHSDGPRQDRRRSARHVGQHLLQRAAFRAGAGADDPVRFRRKDHRRGGLPVRDLDHRARYPRRRPAHLAVADRDGALLRRFATRALPRSSSGRRCRKSWPASGLASSAASRA